MHYLETDAQEREVTAHVHAQLGDYSRSHYTINYEGFTADCVAEFLDELRYAPLTDPTALRLPEDPLSTLFELKNIDGLPRYEELDRTSHGAISLLKSVQAQTRRVALQRLKSECAIEFLLSNIIIPQPTSPHDFLLTAISRRHNRQIGNGKYKNEVPNEFKTLKSTHIYPELAHIEDMVEPELPVDKLQKVQWDLSLPGLRASLESLVKLYKCPPKFDDGHYINKFDLHPEPDVDVKATRFEVLFPRSRQPGHRSNDMTTSRLEPTNYEGLTGFIPILGENLIPSSDDLPAQNMRLIDGWETICSSPPSSPDSPGPSDEDLTDQLCFPPTPDTDPPLVEDILRPKIDIPLFPRSRQPGGMSGIEPGIFKERTTLANFLPSLIPSKANSSQVPKVTSAISSPVPATSVIGQASLVDASQKPNPDDDLSLELEHLCRYTVDAFAPILEETVDDKSVPLMEVPLLPEPTVRSPSESTWIPKSLKELVIANNVNNNQLARPWVKKAPAKQSITLALS